METETLTTKSLLAIIIALMLYQTSSFAQSSWQTGLTTFTSATQTNRLGTATNPTGVNKLDVRFFTNGLERMRLIGEPGATQGFLGLGTTAPKNRLDVSGSAVIGSGFAGLSAFTAPADGLAIQGNVGIGTNRSNLVGNAGQALTIASNVDGTTSATSFEMWLNTNSITSNSPVIDAMRFFAGTAANQNAIIAARISGTNTATGILAFYTRPVGSGVAERMRIDENGKIGIGTFTPTAVLDVNSSAGGEVFRTTSPVATTAAWRMLTGTGTTAEKFAVIINDPAFPKNVILQASQDGALFC